MGEDVSCLAFKQGCDSSFNLLVRRDGPTHVDQPDLTEGMEAWIQAPAWGEWLLEHLNSINVSELILYWATGVIENQSQTSCL